MSKQTLRYSFVVVLVTLVLILVIAQPLAARDTGGHEEIEGTVISLDAGARSFQVRAADGTVHTIVPAADFDFSSLKVGDTVEVEWTLNADGSVSAVTIEHEQADDGDLNDDADDGAHDDADNGADDSDDDMNNKVDENHEGASTAYYCEQSEVQHPAGARLADRYDVAYEDLQAWFCDGFGWGQIKLALQTGDLTGEDPADLLEARRSGQGWGEIWQSLNLIGRSKGYDTFGEIGNTRSNNGRQSDGMKAKDKPAVSDQSGSKKSNGKAEKGGKSDLKKANGKPDNPVQSDANKANGKHQNPGKSNNGKGKK